MGLQLKHTKKTAEIILSPVHNWQVEDITFTPVVKSRFLQNIRTHPLFFCGVLVAIGFSFCLAVMLSTFPESALTQILILTAAMPTCVIAMVFELTVLDRTLVFRLFHTFEFILLVAFAVIDYWPITLDLIANGHFNSYYILVSLVFPVPHILVLVTDASPFRGRAASIALVLIVISNNIYELTLFFFVGARTSKWCYSDTFCSSVYSTFVQPAEIQLLIWNCKYLWLLVCHPHRMLILKTQFMLHAPPTKHGKICEIEMTALHTHPMSPSSDVSTDDTLSSCASSTCENTAVATLAYITEDDHLTLSHHIHHLDHDIVRVSCEVVI